MNKIIAIPGSILITLFALGCGPDAPGEDTLTVEFQGLEALGSGYVYEGWIIVDSNPLSAGRFQLSESQTSFELAMDADTLAAAAAYVLTIEPEVGDDPAPSHTHVLAGDFSGGTASLSIGHPAALNDAFTDATAYGDYILQTPTTMGIAADYNQGIWFFDPVAGSSSLTLPTLPQGWEYEGWIVDASGPISTGRFTDVNLADSDGAGASAGGDGFPPAPGQDYITPALDLVGLAAVITVEPQPDDSAAPFAFKPLVDMNIEDLGAGVLQEIPNQASTLPTGTATIR